MYQPVRERTGGRKYSAKYHPYHRPKQPERSVNGPRMPGLNLKRVTDGLALNDVACVFQAKHRGTGPWIQGDRFFWFRQGVAIEPSFLADLPCAE